MELQKNKKHNKVGEYEHSNHSENCGCKSVTGVTEDTQEQE